MSNTTLSTAVCTEYGGALYALAKDAQIEALLLEEISVLRTLFADEPGYLTLMQTPGIPLAERLSLLDQAFQDRLHPYLCNFLKLLTERRYFREVFGCFDRYEALFNEDHGIAVAKLESATPLDEGRRQQLLTVLEQKTGKKIRLQEEVNLALIGGARLELGGKLYDGSIRSRFDTLASILENTTL